MLDSSWGLNCFDAAIPKHEEYTKNCRGQIKTATNKSTEGKTENK